MRLWIIEELGRRSRLLKLRGELFLKEVKVSVNAAETKRKVPLNSVSHWYLWGAGPVEAKARLQ